MNIEHGLRSKRSLKSATKRTAGAIGLTAALYGAGIGTAAEFFNNSTSTHPSQVINAAINEDLDHSSANELAKSQADILNNHGTIVPRVLNGQIEIINKVGKYTPYVKYPMVLSGNSSNPDKSGKFLEGAWLGFNGTGPQGEVVIDVMPFTNNTERFVAFNPKEIIFRNIGVYATSATTDGNSPDRLLFPQDLGGGFDPAGPHNTVVNIGEYIGLGK